MLFCETIDSFHVLQKQLKMKKTKTRKKKDQKPIDLNPNGVSLAEVIQCSENGHAIANS